MAGDESAPRKRLRVGHVSERGGVNAVRTLLEAHGLVVAEVDGRSDYGRDLIVDITEAGEITGAVIGVQVKGDRRFIRDGCWELPATPKDLRYWAESSVPVAGILWDPDSSELRWANLTGYARTDQTISSWPPRRPPTATPERLVPFPKTHVLSGATLLDMISKMHAYVRQTSTLALLGLFDADDDQRCQAVFDCWTLGRTDARALLMLRRALPSLEGNSLHDAITVLSHLTPHPDIFWHAGNWVPPEIERQVQPAFTWSAREVCDLVCAVEHLDEGDNSWERGGLGQSLWMLFTQDRQLRTVLPSALRLAVDLGDGDAALRLLVIHQYLADDPLSAARSALDRYPILRSHDLSDELVRQIEEFGRLPCIG